VTEDCVFCRIARGVSPADVVYEDDAVMAFKDLYPKAPIHFLIIPRRHIESIAQLSPGDTELMGRCVQVARTLGEQTGFAERGYRLSCNCGPEGGQVVNHLHFHFLAGRRG
jgi:histidine triad (HIT) family protein